MRSKSLWPVDSEIILEQIDCQSREGKGILNSCVRSARPGFELVEMTGQSAGRRLSVRIWIYLAASSVSCYLDVRGLTPPVPK